MDKTIKKLFIFLIIGRLILLIITFVIANNNGVGDHFTNFGNFLTKYGSRWDGNSYSYISQYWYTNTGMEKNYIAFPPVYPLIIRPLGDLLNNYPFAGMLISNILFIFACIIFYKLLKLDYPEKFSFYTVFLISIFPTSFFFSVTYPESLFFLILAITFYLVRIGKFNKSLIFSTLAPLTRPFGVAIYPSLFVSWLKDRKRKVIQLFFLAFSFILSASIYLFINYKVFGDPLAFQIILKNNWQKSFEFPWISIYNSWGRGIFTPEWGEYKFMVGYMEAIFSTLAWILTFGSFFIKKIKLKIEYSLFLLIGVFLFTSTGFILSAPRYFISLPPIFIILAKILDNKIGKLIWIPLSLASLIFLSVKWSEGWWAF